MKRKARSSRAVGLGHGERGTSFQPAGQEATSPQMNDGSGEADREDASEEAVRTKASGMEVAPSMRKVEEPNIDHAVFRSWRPHCIKGRAEA